MNRQRRSALERVAYHEAGHAVAAALLHTHMRSASIIPNNSQGSLGHVGHHRWGKETPDVYDSARIDRRLEQHIITVLAGPEAERKLFGRYNRVGASSDFDTAADLALYRTGGDPKEATLIIRWLAHRTRTLVGLETNWRLIEAVAKALMEHRRLSGQRVREIVGRTRLGDDLYESLRQSFARLRETGNS